MFYFESNTGVAKRIVEKSLTAARAREAARKARETTARAPPRRRPPGSCRLLREGPAICELYIVEGDSPAAPPSRAATAATRPSSRSAAN